VIGTGAGALLGMAEGGHDPKLVDSELPKSPPFATSTLPYFTE